MSYEWLSQVGYSLEILHSSFFILHLSNDRRHNPPSSASVSELAQVDALPDAHVQASVADGDGERGPHQCRFGVRWHVVVALAGMLIVRFAFAHQAVENGCHVRLYVGVGILVDAQRGRCVLDEQMQQPRFGQGRQIAHYFVGHQVEAPPVGRQGKFFLRYHFFGSSEVWRPPAFIFFRGRTLCKYTPKLAFIGHILALIFCLLAKKGDICWPL